PDKKSLDAFDHAFMKSKALVWQDLKSDPRFAQRSEKLDMQNLRKPQIMNLDQQPSARVAAMTLFDRLRSQISLKLPENLPAEKMPTIESSIEKVFAEFVELQLPEKADPVGKVEIQFTRVSAGEFIWAGAGSFDLSSMADATKEKIVTYTPPELYTIASLILPGIGFDNSLFIKELVMEVTAMDAKNHKIAGPLTATFNSSDGTWQDKAGKPCQQLIMDLKDHYDKDKAKLPEGNFKFLTRVTQDIQGKDWTVETIQTGPLFLGEGPLPNPMSSLDTLYVNFDFLTFGEDLKEVKVELNLASAKKKIELSVDADTEPLNFAVLIGRVPENEGEKVRREKIAAEIHFITRTGKIDKKIEDIFADGDSLELYDDMYVEP
ncbi:MAG: hypothetical protein PHD82_12650, partial [Candidatus Riflebacteria bacterium]|nr:hypothetical protein [Candidatus Riflebacteria bacterium]